MLTRIVLKIISRPEDKKSYKSLTKNKAKSIVESSKSFPMFSFSMKNPKDYIILYISLAIKKAQLSFNPPLAKKRKISFWIKTLHKENRLTVIWVQLLQWPTLMMLLIKTSMRLWSSMMCLFQPQNLHVLPVLSPWIIEEKSVWNQAHNKSQGTRASIVQIILRKSS